VLREKKKKFLKFPEFLEHLFIKSQSKYLITQFPFSKHDTKRGYSIS